MKWSSELGAFFGNYAFRQRVPSDVQVVIGRRLIKQTRRTSRLASARLRALILASSHAHAYDLLRDVAL